MSNEYDETVRSSPEELEPIQDLEIDIEEASKVTGGRRSASSDPCEGGE